VCVCVCERVKCLPGKMEFDEKILRGAEALFVTTRIHKRRKRKKNRIS